MSLFAVSPVQWIEGLALVGVIIWIFISWHRISTDEWLIQRWIATGFVISIPVFAGLWYVAKVGPAKALSFSVLNGAILMTGLIILWRGRIANAFGIPFGNLFFPSEAEEDRPLYSMAESRIKQGRYHEALSLIDRQMHRFPKDMQLHLMKAEVLADHLGDFPKAMDTLEHFLAQKTRSAKNKAFVLNRMADLILKHSGDINAATVAVRRIVELAPNTDVARAAVARLGRLEERRTTAAEEPHAIKVEHHEHYPDRDAECFSKPAPMAADDDARIAELIERLKIQPDDHLAREELALIYANDLKRADLAMEQMDILGEFPGLSAAQFARWMNMKADFATGVAGDVEIAREALNRIVFKYPKSPAATNATRRIALLPHELLRHKNAQPVKLGVYEKDIGLKRDQ